jgi:hypothetical protein
VTCAAQFASRSCQRLSSSLPHSSIPLMVLSTQKGLPHAIRDTLFRITTGHPVLDALPACPEPGRRERRQPARLGRRVEGSQLDARTILKTCQHRIRNPFTICTYKSVTKQRTLTCSESTLTRKLGRGVQAWHFFLFSANLFRSSAPCARSE